MTTGTPEERQLTQIERWRRVITIAAVPMILVATVGMTKVDPDGTSSSYQAHLAAAEKSFRLGEATELRRWLDGAPAEHRGWEWEHLHALADTTSRAVAAGEPILRVVISPDGNRLATVEGSVVILRDPTTFEEIDRIEGHAEDIHRAEFSPDGTRLATVSRDVTSRVWDLETLEEVSRIDLANPAVAAVAFSPDGSRVATCAWERDDGAVHGVVWVWDAATGEFAARTRVGVKPLSSLRWLPDGSGFLVGSWDGLVHHLDASGQEIRRLEIPDEGVYRAVDDIAITPDGTCLAAACRDRTVRILEVSTGAQLAVLRGHVAPVGGVVISSDGSSIATASIDATVRIWSPDGTLRRTLRGPLRALRAVAWVGDELVAAGEEGALFAWHSAPLGGPERTIAIDESGYSAELTPDGSRVAIACYDGTLRIHRTADGEELARWDAHPGSTCHAATFDDAGARVITASWDHTARVWDTETHAELARLDAGAGVFSADLSPDGTEAAVCAGDAQLWEIGTKTLRHTFPREGAQPRRAEFDRTGARVAFAWSDGAATVHDSATGERLAIFEGLDSALESVAFAVDGSEIFTASRDGTVRAFPASGGPPRFTCRTGDRPLHELAVSGDRIAACGDRLYLIDASRGGIVLERTLAPDTSYHTSWSADGTTLAACATQSGIVVLTTKRTMPGPRAPESGGPMTGGR